MAAEHVFKGQKTELSYGAEGYPQAFLDMPNPPKKLYIIGDPFALTEGLAVVGARNATPYGRACAHLFAGQAAKLGICIISGGARGCDAFAHEAALKQGGKTVAFLGGGCDVPYPTCNVKLFQQIIDSGGAIVSENPWGFQALPYTFRARNRLIAALSRATLIVEAGMPSGTFSTADEALAANREVLVVPGSVFSQYSQGANALLGQGAIPVVDQEGFNVVLNRLFFDVIDGGLEGRQSQLQIEETKSSLKEAVRAMNCKRYAAGQKPVLPSTDEVVSIALDLSDVSTDDALLKTLRACPLRLEELTAVLREDDARYGKHLSEIMARVGKLEALGMVTRFPDGRFGVCES